MHGFASTSRSLPDFTPLTSVFGDRLTVVRDGNRVQWSLNGRSAIVELRSEGMLDATFVERPMTESVSAQAAAAMYRGDKSGYRLAADGSSRMVADIVAFFGGVREPRFTFAGVYGGRSASL